MDSPAPTSSDLNLEHPPLSYPQPSQTLFSSTFGGPTSSSNVKQENYTQSLCSSILLLQLYSCTFSIPPALPLIIIFYLPFFSINLESKRSDSCHHRPHPSAIDRRESPPTSTLPLLYLFSILQLSRAYSITHPTRFIIFIHSF